MSNNKHTLALHAHTMRQARTDSEARLWRVLRSSQLGVAFRRQVPLPGFIADFYAQRRACDKSETVLRSHGARLRRWAEV